MQLLRTFQSDKIRSVPGKKHSYGMERERGGEGESVLQRNHHALGDIRLLLLLSESNQNTAQTGWLPPDSICIYFNLDSHSWHCRCRCILLSKEWDKSVWKIGFTDYTNAGCTFCVRGAGQWILPIVLFSEYIKRRKAIWKRAIDEKILILYSVSTNNIPIWMIYDFRDTLDQRLDSEITKKEVDLTTFYRCSLWTEDKFHELRIQIVSQGKWHKPNFRLYRWTLQKNEIVD